MHDSQEHIFTNEFDDVCIAISLNLDTAAASMQITISDPERNRVWNELVSAQQKDAGGLSAFEGGL